MKRVLWFFQAAAVIVVSFPFALLPCRAGELLGLIVHRLWRSRREIALDNIRQSSLSSAIDHEAVIRENFRNYGRSFIELLKVYYGFGDRLLRNITIEGMEYVERARAKGKGIIFLTGHCGNWELLAIASSFKGFGLSVVARPLNNPYLNRLLEKTRARFGNRVISKRGALKSIFKTLGDGGYIGILMDQAVIPQEGYVIDFLGRGAWTTKMPALIARKTEAPVLTVFIRRAGKGHEILIRPELTLSSGVEREEAVIEDTKRFSRRIEEYIEQNPSEWLWLHRRWKRVPRTAERPIESGIEVAA